MAGKVGSPVSVLLGREGGTISGPVLTKEGGGGSSIFNSCSLDHPRRELRSKVSKAEMQCSHSLALSLFYYNEAVSTLGDPCRQQFLQEK